MSAFYNEIDRYPAQWMRNLIDAGHIAPGVVDERSIADLKPEDLEGYEQAHFFAGIGVWSHALRLAGWPDDAPLWTGSCPCQPFSVAGKRGGHRDERHLWPAWFRLIRERRPPVVFGEQVSSKDGLAWLDAVRADLEGEGYAVGAADLCAASVGAPHIRQRVFFVAYATDADWRAGERGEETGVGQNGERWGRPSGGRHAGELADAERGAAERRGRDVGAAESGVQGTPRERERIRDDAGHGEQSRGMADAEGGDGRLPVRQRRPEQGVPESGGRSETGDGFVGDTDSERGCGRTAGIEDAADARAPGEAHGPGRKGFWSDARWVWCRDGFWRPHGPEPGAFPLVDGAAFKLGSGQPEEGRSRSGMLRGYGNAIVAPLAAEFIAAFMATLSACGQKGE